jgi:hypothetical protein
LDGFIHGKYAYMSNVNTQIKAKKQK